MARRIYLTQGRYTVVDNADFEELNRFRWFFDSNGYAARNITSNGKWVKTIRLHRVVARTPDDLVCDHINGNRLDNRRVNIRNCSQQQNCWNRPTGRRPLRGMSFYPLKRKWQVRINGKSVGYFDTQEQAAMAHDLWVISFHGEFSRTNFKVVLRGP